MVDVVEYPVMVSALAPIADRVIGLYLLESGSSRLPTVPRRMRMHNRCVGHHGGRHAPSVGRRATIGTYGLIRVISSTAAQTHAAPAVSANANNQSPSNTP